MELECGHGPQEVSGQARLNVLTGLDEKRLHMVFYSKLSSHPKTLFSAPQYLGTARPQWDEESDPKSAGSPVKAMRVVYQYCRH